MARFSDIAPGLGLGLTIAGMRFGSSVFAVQNDRLAADLVGRAASNVFTVLCKPPGFGASVGRAASNAPYPRRAAGGPPGVEGIVSRGVRFN